MAEEFPLPAEVLESPLTLLCFYDDDIREGRVKLSDWQRRLLGFFGGVHNYGDACKRAMLLAANGSGKSQFILAPIAIWSIMKFTECLTIITTASGAQLDGQDLRYCKRLAEKINSLHRAEFPEGVIECQYRKFRNKITESFIDMFATDEPGKAEGKHPLKYDGKFFILVDEGKTVADSIYEALERCTGCTHRLDISSAGASMGRFYSDWHFEDKDVFKERVTAFDCPHIAVKDVEKKIRKHGLHDPLVRSMIFSEFTSTDQQVVISRELALKSINLADTFYNFGPARAGLDLAAGGDENALSVWKGNKEIGRHWFKFTDTSKTVLEVIEIIKSYKGELLPENIYADDGGVGRGILDNFREKGYTFRRVLNQSRPFDTTRYSNRGTELWFNFKRFMEEFQVLFERTETKGEIDPQLLSQLTNRYYKIQDGTGKLILESKQTARKNGHPSPDRADAVILAWSSLMFPVIEMSGGTSVTTTDNIQGSVMSNEQIINAYNLERHNKFRSQIGLGSLNEGANIKRSGTYTQKQMANIHRPAFKHSAIFGGTKNAIGRYKLTR